MIDFLCQIEFLQLKMLELLKIPGFSGFLIKIPGFSIPGIFKISQIPYYFCLKCQIPGFQVKWQPWGGLK